MLPPTMACLAESNSLAMGCWKADGTLVDGNDALLSLLSCSREDIHAGKIRWPEITPPEYAPLDARAMNQIKTTGECTPFEKEYVLSDGRRVPVLIGARAFENTTDAGFFFMVDLSKRSTLSEIAASARQVHSLSARQRTICLLLSRGEPDKRIASKLQVGLRTVEMEKQRSAKSLGMRTSSLVIWSVENRKSLEASLHDESAALVGLCSL